MALTTGNGPRESRRFWRCCLVSLIIVAAAGGSRSQAAAATTSTRPTPELWAVVRDGLEDRASVRSGPRAAKRLVRVDGALLRQRTTPGSRLRLHLAPQVEVDVALTRITESELNGYVWNGRVVDEPFSMVTLLLEPGGVAGSVLYSGGSYHIRLVGDGLSVVAFQPHGRRGGAVPPPAGARVLTRSVAPRAARGSSQWDFLALFTKQAIKDLGGGVRAVKADWKVAIANWNTALDNTGLKVEVRLVKTRKWNVKSGSTSSLFDVLDDLTNDPKVAKLRKRSGADIVGAALLNDPAACNLGWITGSGDGGVQADDSARAFNVSSVECLAGFGGLGVAFVAGANVGLQVYEGVSSFGGAYPYARGYRVGDEFRTVMTQLCSSEGCSFFPIPYYSTPLVESGDTPIGIADENDNARSIDNDRGTVEQWFPCEKQC